MPITNALTTEIHRVSILDEHGQFDAKLGEDLIPNNDLIKLYEEMSLCRKLDEIAFKLQRSGRMGTYPQNMGQEANSLGAAYVAGLHTRARVSPSPPPGRRRHHRALCTVCGSKVVDGGRRRGPLGPAVAPRAHGAAASSAAAADRLRRL